MWPPAGSDLSKVPRHDWASHGADAFRTAAVIRQADKLDAADNGQEQ
jgi:hypothetical protein